jgi:hypothetical protein
MKLIGITSTAILSLLLGVAAPAHAQREQQGDKQDHPQEQQSKHEQAKPDHQSTRQQQQSDRGEQRARQRQDQHNQQQHARQRDKDRPQHTQERQGIQQSAWQQHRSQHWDSDHRTWQQRGGYRGYRIPDDRFRGYFGPEHGFRVHGLPSLVVGGYPRFQYGGYWVSAVDPWPEYWGDNWYDNDDVYIVYANNGYYLYDRRYPNAGVAISISF